MDHTANYAIILRHNCAVTESAGYSQFASLLAHNRTTAYCSSQLKQGTYLIGLNYPAVLQLIDYIQRTCHWQLLLHTLVSKKE